MASPEVQYHLTAGGVVLNEAGLLLVLERDVLRDGALRHEVRLPKGHIDPGETPEQAALREVHEESGYAEMEIVADLGEAHSHFEFRGQHHEREERYFLMRLTNPEPRGQMMHPDSEEFLFRPAWFSIEEAISRLTYPTEQEFARRTQRHLASGQ